MPSPVGEVEAEKVSDHFVKDASSPNKTKIIGDRKVEWKNVQTLSECKSTNGRNSAYP